MEVMAEEEKSTRHNYKAHGASIIGVLLIQLEYLRIKTFSSPLSLHKRSGFEFSVLKYFHILAKALNSARFAQFLRLELA